MIKLPARQDGQWTVTHNSDKLPDLFATRNLSFDKEGYLRLSKPVSCFYNEAQDADFGLPLLFGRITTGLYYVLTDEAQFDFDMVNFGASTGGYLDVAQTTALNAPTNSASWPNYAGACIFNGEFHYATYQEVYSHPGGSFSNDWTDRNLSTSLGMDWHPMCNDVSNVELAVGDGNQVKLFSTAYALTTTLTLPTEYSVTGIAYNNGFLGITCHDNTNGGNGKFYVWDGKSNTSSANYAYDIGASTCTTPVPYQGSFVILNGTGQLLYWTPQSLQVLASFPSYFTGSQMFVGNGNCSRNESVKADGELILINVDSYLSSETEDGEAFIANQPSGIWCYDPAVGLYHRHSTSSLMTTVDVVATTDVNTTDNQITVTTAFETGTPVRYSDSGSTTLAGLESETIYYTIYVNATTIQLAETLTLAEAGTAIDLTGTGNSFQTLQFYPKSDFGQSYTQGSQGVIYLEETPSQTGQYSNGLFFGAHAANTTTTEYDAGGFVLKDSENRGHFITAKIRAKHLSDTWQKLYIKHRKLVSDLDKIVVKYRTTDDGVLVKIDKETSSGLITWTDSTTFTTTDSQFASVLAGDEVEIVQGAGAGYLAHISAISEASGTYTVTLDETIKNLTAAQTGRVVVSRWTKLSTITKDTVRNDDGYSEITVGMKSKMIQFKVELRGEDIEIEELLISNTLSKPV